MTAMNTETAAMTAAPEEMTMRSMIDRVEKMASESGERFAELMAPYLDEADYDEDFEDTLERKYQEGFSEAASLILDLLKKNLPEIEKNIQRQEGCDVLDWLREVYGEGIEDTGAWAHYFEEENN